MENISRLPMWRRVVVDRRGGRGDGDADVVPAPLCLVALASDRLSDFGAVADEPFVLQHLLSLAV